MGLAGLVPMVRCESVRRSILICRAASCRGDPCPSSGRDARSDPRADLQVVIAVLLEHFLTASEAEKTRNLTQAIAPRPVTRHRSAVSFNFAGSIIQMESVRLRKECVSESRFFKGYDC